MADQPINYSLDVQQPFQALMQGYQGGSAIRQDQLQAQQQQFALQQQQQAIPILQGLLSNPNATANDYATASVMVPGFKDQIKQAWDIKNPAQQQQAASDAGQYYAALTSGQPQVAAKLMTDRAAALESSGGNPQEVNGLRTMAQIATLHPELARTMVGMKLSAIPGGDKLIEGAKGLADLNKTTLTTPADVRKANAQADMAVIDSTTELSRRTAETDKIRADIDNMAGRLGLDRDRLASETQLKLHELGLQYGAPPPEATKIINDSATSAAAGEQQAGRLEDLANRMESTAKATGFAGTAAEAAKSAWGAQDGVSALKQEYTRIVQSGALSSMKDALGGRVTDVDMKAALGQIPDANSSPEVVTSFLRGTAKLTRLQAAMDNAKAEWLSQAGHAGHLGKLKQDITVMGTQVPAGTTFADFSRQFIRDKADQLAAQSAVGQAQSRSYMRFAQPGQPQPGQ